MPIHSRLKPGHILAEQWFIKAALEAHADAYVQYLTERGYARETVECYFRSVAHFVHWASQQDVALCDINEAVINRFLDGHLPHCRCAPRCRRTRTDAHAALKHFLVMLGDVEPQQQTPDVPIVNCNRTGCL